MSNMVKDECQTRTPVSTVLGSLTYVIDALTTNLTDLGKLVPIDN